MSNIILTANDFGHNTYYISDAMKDTKRVKSGELVDVNDDDWVIRWGCTARIRNDKAKVINRKSAIRETMDKGGFRQKVAAIGHAPRTWMDKQDFAYDIVFNHEPFVPVIVRPQAHQRSENLHFCQNTDELVAAVDAIGGPLYISEYIAKDKEYRVFVANGRAMIMAEKVPVDRNAITWGCVEDGELEYIAWSNWLPEVAQCAIESFNLSKLDFAAIDVMWKDGKAYFLEANTAPEVWRYYGQCFAKVFTYMTDGDKRARIPVANYDDWKNYIHPAISDKAVV